MLRHESTKGESVPLRFLQTAASAHALATRSSLKGRPCGQSGKLANHDMLAGCGTVNATCNTHAGSADTRFHVGAAAD